MSVGEDFSAGGIIVYEVLWNLVHCATYFEGHYGLNAVWRVPHGVLHHCNNGVHHEVWPTLGVLVEVTNSAC
jgi:hypothetical protein